MNLLVVIAVLAAFGVLRFLRVGLLLWAGAWWVGVYVLLRFGFTAPIPASVVTMYMGIVTLAILAYVSSSEDRRDEAAGTLVRFMTERGFTPLLAATVVACAFDVRRATGTSTKSGSPRKRARSR